MCYSARIKADFARYVREYGADIDIHEFVDLYWRRRVDGGIKTPRAMDLFFLNDDSPEFDKVRESIRAVDAATAARIEQDLGAQRQRLATAESALTVKVTKKAQEDQRIAGNKIAAAQRRLADLRRTEPNDADSRIYPGVWAPVIVSENGRRMIKPMRYGCRPSGKAANYDQRFPGTYNARRDNLIGFWRGQFGHTHGIMIVTQFFENVDRAGKNVVLEFDPSPPQDMLVACLWSRWTKAGEPDLLSFAAITDEPPPEVAAAGHDRCIVPIRPGDIDAWLKPQSSDEALAALDDRAQPYYEHKIAA